MRVAIIVVAGVVGLFAGQALAQTTRPAPAAQTEPRPAPQSGSGNRSASAKPRPRTGLDLRSPTFVIAPEYGRYGYLGDGTDFGRDQTIYLSR